MVHREIASKLIGRICPHRTPEECQAYAAPFPDSRFESRLRRFPNIVPDHPNAEDADLSRRARDWLKREWNGQTFMAVGMKDPVLGPILMVYLRSQVRNCPAPFEHSEAGHFVQEWGQEITERALKAFG